MKKINIQKSFTAEMAARADGSFEAYASRYGVVDSHNDVVVKGAFADSLKKHGLPQLYANHDNTLTIGRITKCVEADDGLVISGQFNTKNVLAANILEEYRAGNMNQFSCGGWIMPSSTQKRADGTREIRKWDRLIEVSTVTLASNEQATLLSVKDLDGVATIRDLEAALRPVMSQQAAIAFLSMARQILINSTDEDFLNADDEPATETTGDECGDGEKESIKAIARKLEELNRRI